MSHDVDLNLSEQDVTLSFTMPGRLVYLFVHPKGSEERERSPRFSRDDWDVMTTVVNEYLKL